MTIALPITPAESAAIAYCLACHIDNEADKNDGIGADMINHLQPCLLFCANGDGDVLLVDLLQLAQIRRALDIYQEDHAVDYSTVVSLLARIDAIGAGDAPAMK